MQLDSVRSLKAGLNESVIVPMASSMVVRSSGLRAQPMRELSATPPTIALGVTRHGKNDYRLAVRVQKRGLENSPYVETIRKKAKGEVDVRYIGIVDKRVTPAWHQRLSRPLRVGTSIGHYKITAGTLGCFVKDSADGAVMILSNNHVLANENRAKKGDVVIQPGAFDVPVPPGDVNDPDLRVGELVRFVRMKKAGANAIDAAVASIDSGIEYNYKTLTGIGKLKGFGDAMPDDKVAKVGRTTGSTRGKVSAFEIDNVLVRYDVGVLQFDNQIEIESTENGPFSQGGDSGSLIVNEEEHGVALLFAGSDHGGSNGLGLTFANPLRTVLDALKVELYTT